MKSQKILSILPAIIILVVAFVGGNITGKSIVKYWKTSKVATPAPTKAPAKTQNQMPNDKPANFAETIDKNAKESSTLEVTDDCALNPEIVKVKYDTNLTLVNKGKTQHTLTINTQKVVLPPNQSEEFQVKFDKTEGIYGVQCDTTAKEGYLYVRSK